MATNCPRTRPSWIGTIIKKASKRAREQFSSVHPDPDPLEIIWSDTTIVFLTVAGCQFGSDGVTNQGSLGTQWVNR